MKSLCRSERTRKSRNWLGNVSALSQVTMSSVTLEIRLAAARIMNLMPESRRSAFLGLNHR